VDAQIKSAQDDFKLLPASQIQVFIAEIFPRTALHQPRMPHYIGGKDRGETAGLAHVS